MRLSSGKFIQSLDGGIGMPKVSVVMPVYNREAYIYSAIESVLNQTYADFELIIVDDGSTDKTIEIINSFSDKRIKVIQHSENKGVAAARNTGYRASGGEFVVIADSDDINLPNKLQKQVEYLDDYSEISVVGCHYQHFKDLDILGKWEYYEEDSYIRAMRVFENQQAPASMFRKARIENLGLLYHDESFGAAVDSQWFYAMPKGIKFANIAEALYLYRRHTDQFTNENDSENIQARCMRKLYIEELKKLDMTITKKNLDTHWALRSPNMQLSENVPVKNVVEWCEKLIKANASKELYDQNVFKSLVSEKLYNFCKIKSYLGNETWSAWEAYPYKHTVKKHEDIVSKLNNFSISRLVKGRKVAVFGTLQAANALFNVVENNGGQVVGYIDNRWRAETNQINKRPVYSDEVLKKDFAEVVIISVVSYTRFLIRDHIRAINSSLEIILLDDVMK